MQLSVRSIAWLHWVQRGPYGRLLCFLVLGIATAIFSIRGVSRGLRQPVDYAVVYAQGRAWDRGLVPYDYRVLSEVYLDGGAPKSLLPMKDYTSAVHPPTLLPLAGSIAWLSWEPALLLWFALLVAGVLVASYYFSEAIGRAGPLARACLVGVFLCFSPILAGVSMGQPSVLAISLILLAFTPRVLAKPSLAALFVGIAACLKPQLGVPFFLPLLALQRKYAFAAVVSMVCVGLIALAPLTVNHQEWFGAWMDNIQVSSNSGNANDPSPANPDSWKLVNLQPLLMLVLHSSLTANTMAVLVAGCGMVFWWRYRPSLRNTAMVEMPLFLLALSGLTLLSSYHRSYDAALLLFGVPSAISVWRQRRRVATAVLGLQLGVFAVPIPGFLVLFAQRIHLQTGLPISGVFWQILLRHQNILILSVTVTAFWLARFSGRKNLEPSLPMRSA